MFESDTEYGVLNFSMLQKNRMKPQKKIKIKIRNNYAKPQDKE